MPILAASQQAPPAAMARQILAQLVGINTVHDHGITAAARAMQQRLLAAGFAPADAQLLGGNPSQMNLVARLHGTGAKPPILLLAHLDVVQARRQDWTTDPFQLVTKDGFFWGRGTQDVKDGDAIYVANLIRLKQEGFRPDRDIVLALTADEEDGPDNGVQWLLAHHPEVMKAAFVLNADGGGVDAIQGKPRFLGVDASQKVYADFQLSTTNPGGHSSIPVPDNAIYHVAAALMRVQRFEFPIELNAVTRGYFAARSRLDAAAGAAAQAADESAMTPAALARLARDPKFNALLRTTCVATRLSAGDANNALPQNAEALVNCRILPGHAAADVQRQLAAVVADPKIRIQFMAEDTSLHDVAPQLVSNPPLKLDPEVLGPLTEVAQAMWNIPVVPTMATGATDSKYTMAAGMPSYDVIGVAVDEGGDRAHGRDENLRIASFDQGTEFCYRLLKRLTTP